MSNATVCWYDHQREEGTIEAVGGPHKGWYDVRSNNGWSCGVSAEYGVEPKVGDYFVTWGGMGLSIRGQAINGRVLYYRTKDEQRAEDQKAADRSKAERLAEYEAKRSAYDTRVLALPAPLRERVESFRAFGGDAWRWEFEPYELVCCEEAAKIVKRFSTVAEIERLAKMDWQEQATAFPEMDKGHSGNTWGTSLRFAHALVERPELLVQMHGALCPLVGCESYGCYAVRRTVSRGTAERGEP